VRLEEAQRLSPPAAAGLLARFAGRVHELSTEALQELFTQTFDLNPVCSLELGWHLFGETYDRGTMLVKMREQLRAYGIQETEELPDHLTHALALLARMPRDAAEDFTAACVLPALEKMLAALKGKQNAFEDVLLAVEGLLHAEFPNIPLTPPAEAKLPVLPEGVVS
jgi:nitrate reductase delta subunit